MKLMVLACLTAAALARPDRLSGHGHQQQEYGQPELQQYVQHEPQYQQQQQQQQQHYRSSSAEKLDPAHLRDRNAQITSFSNQWTQDGGNTHSFTADNGMEREEKIELKEVYATDEYGKEYLTVVPIYTGSFTFLQPDGSVVVRHYTTDESGHLRFEANDLPQPPQVQPANTYQ